MKLSVERAPFLCERLKIHMLPTIGLVVDGKTKEFIKGLLHRELYYVSEGTLYARCHVCKLSLPGFDELGGTDDFATELLEWRLGCAAVINYSGNLLEPPTQGTDKNQVSFHSKKTIRDSALDSSDSD